MSARALRYSFTFIDPETKKEYYHGNTIIEPTVYHQNVKLTIPIKGITTILDGHDFYSHHRRFSMTQVREATNNAFQSNFSRYAVDFTVLGRDGNTRTMDPREYPSNYDFHFTDVTRFYTHTADVRAPADGEVVAAVDHLEDHYNISFNMDEVIQEERVTDIAGNHVVIKHNESEFSHLFHLLKGSVKPSVGDAVSRNQIVAKIGFSGAATLYSHLHYQLMDGEAFLTDNPLPCQFSDVSFLLGKEMVRFDRTCIDTGDFILQE